MSNGTDNKKVFSYVKNSDDSTIDWSEPDYTGASASKYVDKYTNRPEDAGTMEGLQNLLGVIGLIPGVGEPADWINASLYASQGDATNAALYGSGLGMAGNILGKNKKIVEYATKKFDELGFDNIGEAAKHLEEFRKFEKNVDATPGIVDATPIRYIDRFAKWYRDGLSSIKQKMLDLRNNPNVLENMNRVMDENVKRYTKKK
jgi:hypothetical protein